MNRNLPILSASLAIGVLAGCAVPSRGVVTICELPRSMPGTSLPQTNAETVRHSGVVKGYSIARYVDPGDPRVLHEGHVIYVEEASPAWDLRPHQPVFVPLGPAVAAPEPANAQARSADEWILQFQEQRQATQKMREQSERFQEALGGLAATITLTTNLASQMQLLGRQQRGMVDRLQLLEEAARRDQHPASNAAATGPAVKR